MQTQIHRRSGPARLNRDGSALLTVMILAAAMLAAAGTVLLIAQRTAFFSSKMKKDISAICDAEAGVSIMLDKMSKSQADFFYWSANRTLVTNFNEATLTINTSTRTNMSTGVYAVRISSTAAFGAELRNTVVETRYVPIFFYQVLAGGDITVDTGAVDIYGDIHANHNLLHSSGTPSIYGNVSCSGGTLEITPVPPGTSVVGAPPVNMALYDCRSSFPQWMTMAMSGGIYFSNSVSLNGDVLRPSNGVVYVRGDITLARKSDVYGVVVAEGSIDISQQFDQYAPTNVVPSWWLDNYVDQYGSNWPSLLAGGDITERNRNVWAYPGAFFAAGSIEIRNRRTFGGNMVAMTNVSIRNDVNINNQGFVMTNAIDLEMGPWLK